MVAVMRASVAGCGRLAFDQRSDAGLPAGTLTVGFEIASTLVDEASGTVDVAIVLSAPADVPVAVTCSAGEVQDALARNRPGLFGGRSHVGCDQRGGSE